jgi:peptide subunit release factor 1 (eRF1)
MRDFHKQVARRTFEILQESSFQWIFIGCRDDIFQEMEPLLHPYVKQRFRSRIRVGLGDPTDQILKSALELKNRLKREEKEDLVQRFLTELGRNGLAVSGLHATLQTLNQGKLQTLLVTRHVSYPGRRCTRCGFLFEDEKECPSCRIPTEPLADVVDEAVSKALNSSSRVIHVNPPSPLEGKGNVGAFLRYKT